MYQRVRKNAVSRWMIEAATQRRLAGDPAGACAAAGVELDVDPAAVALAQGRGIADEVDHDLHHLTPDLLRWHIPRALDPPGQAWALTGVLRHYPPGNVQLLVDRLRHNPARLRVRVLFNERRAGAPLTSRGPGMYHLPRAYWDARYTGELRRLCGGAERVPFFHSDGRPRDVDELAVGPCPHDPVAHAEWLTMLCDHGRTGEALAACGVETGRKTKRRSTSWPPVAVERLLDEARRVLDAEFGGYEGQSIWVDGVVHPEPGPDLRLTFEESGAVTLRRGQADPGEQRMLTLPEYRHPIDLDLLRFGYLRPEDLHPLVLRALFPARAVHPDSGPPPPTWSLSGGQEEQRQELMDRAFYGDTEGVLALLDAGYDARTARNDAGETLLHLMLRLDHDRLLARLLDLGLDVNAADARGWTPLHTAVDRLVGHRHPGDLIDRLLAAGAVDNRDQGRSRRSLRAVGMPAATVSSKPDTKPRWSDMDTRGYRSMARRARALYAEYHGPHRVLAECYGVDFPEELFVIARQLPLVKLRSRELATQVWRMAVPPHRGGVPLEVPSLDLVGERLVSERDARLIPLVSLHDLHFEHGGLNLCYSREELVAGRSTVFGVAIFDPDEPVRRCGDSLLELLHEYHADLLRRLQTRRQADAPGLGSVKRAREALQEVRQLRCRLLGAVPPDPAPPEPGSPDRWRTAASRLDYASMARLARSLYATGLTPPEVLSECYGVDFPDEVFAVSDADISGLVRLTNQPWGLMIPTELGGPRLRPHHWVSEERDVVARDPDLLPLLPLYSDARHSYGEILPPPPARHGGLMICYRLSELAAGRTTTYGVKTRDAHGVKTENGRPVRRCGDSLLDTLHEHFADRHALDEWQVDQPWNRGFGAIGARSLEQSREACRRIDEVRDRLIGA